MAEKKAHDPSGDAAGHPDTKTTGPERSPGVDDEFRRLPSPEAFGLLADRTRMAILRALWERRDAPVSFSELHDAVDVDRGNFNYHLSKLVPHVVRRTGKGYELRAAGRQVIRAVSAGTITSDPSLDPTALGISCPICEEGALEVQYVDTWLTVRCSDCPGVLGEDAPKGTLTHHEFPPAGLRDRGTAEVFEAGRVYHAADLVTMRQGVCPTCAGPIDRELHICERHVADADGPCPECGSVRRVRVEHGCAHCGARRWSQLWQAVLYLPAVISFVYERRPFDDLTDLGSLAWHDPDSPTDVSQTVVSVDPPLVRVDVEADGDRLGVTVDANLDVVAIE